MTQAKTGGSWIPLIPFTASGQVEILVPEGADSTQLTAAYHQARKDAKYDRLRTPSSDAHPLVSEVSPPQ